MQELHLDAERCRSSLLIRALVLATILQARVAVRDEESLEFVPPGDTRRG